MYLVKGFAAVLVLVIVLTLALVGAGLYFFVGGNSRSVTPSTQETEEEQLQVTTSPGDEIKAKTGDVEFVISPSEDKNIKGVVTFTATKVPEGTEVVGFAIQGGAKEPLENIGIDSNEEDGWSYLFDTEKYENGLYIISAIAAKEIGDAPLGGTMAQVVIQN